MKQLPERLPVSLKSVKNHLVTIDDQTVAIWLSSVVANSSVIVKDLLVGVAIL